MNRAIHLNSVTFSSGRKVLERDHVSGQLTNLVSMKNSPNFLSVACSVRCTLLSKP